MNVDRCNKMRKMHKQDFLDISTCTLLFDCLIVFYARIRKKTFYANKTRAKKFTYVITCSYILMVHRVRKIKIICRVTIGIRGV